MAPGRSERTTALNDLCIHSRHSAPARITRHLSSVEKAISPAAIVKFVAMIAAAWKASVNAAPASAMTAPASAVAIRPPVRAMALLKPDAVPVCRRSSNADSGRR